MPYGDFFSQSCCSECVGATLPAAISGTILFIIGATTFSQVLSFSGVINGIVGPISGTDYPTMVVIVGMLLTLSFSAASSTKSA